MLRDPGLTVPGVHPHGVFTPAQPSRAPRNRRSINAKGRPRTEEAEAGKAEDDCRRTLGKGNGGLDPLTEEEVSDARSGWLNPALRAFAGEGGGGSRRGLSTA